ncbi:MAG: PAS domain S-box protein, partial [Candidatus Hermodarchaeota archaeon]
LKLKESEEKYRELFEKSPISLWEEDFSEVKKYTDNLKAQGVVNLREYLDENPEAIIKIISLVKILNVNKKTLEMLKFDTKEDLLVKLGNVFTDEAFKTYKEGIIAFFNGETRFESELIVNTKQGQQLNILTLGEIVSGYEKDWSKVLNSVINITALKKTEQLLIESEEKFRNITEQSLMGIGIIQDNKIKYVNKKCANIFGYTIEEMMQWAIKDVVNAMHPEDREFLIPQVSKKQRGENGYETSYQYRGIKKSGEVIWIENYSKSIQYNGKPADLLTIIDITEQKIAEQKLRESEENYRRAYERENFYKDLFTHDMSNILQGMLTSLEIYELESNTPELTDKSKNLTKIYKDQVKRAVSLVNNVRKFSDLDKSQIILEKIDFRKTIAKAYNIVLNQVRDKKINLRTDFLSNIFIIKADDFLVDVFENLLYNSVKYNENEVIEITIRSSTTEKDDNRLLKIE